MQNTKTSFIKIIYMKNKLLIAFLLIVQFTVKGNNNDSIAVTNIANCGFMIEMDSIKIIIDGLFINGFNFYATPDSATLDLITKRLEPFDDIDYIFVTHKHADHYDAQTVIAFMINNSKCRLICPKQVIDNLKEYPDQYKIFDSRVFDCTPDTFNSTILKLDHLDIIAYRLIHGNEKNKDIENIAFLISSNNKSIFHTGDADPNQVDKYVGIIPSENDIDIAFINGAFGNYKNFQITNSFIAAKKNIAMHFPKDFFKMQHKMITDVPDYFIEPIVFKELMERKVFYITE